MAGLMLAAEQSTRTPITIRIVMMGRGITNYVTHESRTLGALLEELQVTDHMDVRVNGATVDKTYWLGNSDQVLVVPKIRGGAR